MLAKFHLPNWLLILLILVFILRIPSFFEPYWYGDEAISLTLGQAMSHGLTLYRDIHDNKPPLLYLVSGIAGNMFWLKAILAFWSLATITLFAKLAKDLWPTKEKVVRIATVAFALLSTLPLLEGNIANGELFMILPTIASFLLLRTKTQNPKNIYLAGLVLGIGPLFKIPSIIDAAVPIAFWVALFLTKKTNARQLVKQTAIFALGVLTPIFVTIVYFFFAGALKNYLQSAFSQNVGYLSSWSGTHGGFIERNQGLILRAALVLVGFFTLSGFYKRGKISQSFLFISLWFIFSLFASVLSERPYPHYLIQVIPSFSLMLALAFSGVTKEQFFPYPFFLTLGIVLVLFKFTYYPVFPYYANFLSFITGKVDQNQFFANFDSRTPRIYKTVKFLLESAKSDDKLFVWGNDTEIYALSKMTPSTRYIAAYHIKDFNGFSEVITTLYAHPARFIVVSQDLATFPALSALLDKEYLKIEQFDRIRIYLHIEKK